MCEYYFDFVSEFLIVERFFCFDVVVLVIDYDWFDYDFIYVYVSLVVDSCGKYWVLL